LQFAVDAPTCNCEVTDDLSIASVMQPTRRNAQISHHKSPLEWTSQPGDQPDWFQRALSHPTFSNGRLWPACD